MSGQTEQLDQLVFNENSLYSLVQVSFTRIKDLIARRQPVGAEVRMSPGVVSLLLGILTGGHSGSPQHSYRRAAHCPAVMGPSTIEWSQL